MLLGFVTMAVSDALPLMFHNPKLLSEEEKKHLIAEALYTFHPGSVQDRLMQQRGYNLGDFIGKGAFSKVYKAKYVDRTVKRKTQRLACKLMNGESMTQTFFRKYVPREIEIMSELRHPNIVSIHSVLQFKLEYYIFMQRCDRGDLLNFIRRNGALKEIQARIWFSQALKGVHYLNQKNVAHRDIKCENLLLSKSFNLRIADFGFARIMGPGEIRSHTFCGSIAYCAPEIVRGKPYEPQAADIWSLGVVLFVMFNKSLPFDETNLKKLYDAQMKGLWRIRAKASAFISEDGKEFLKIMLEPVPSKRLLPKQLWDHAWIQESFNYVEDINNSIVRTKTGLADEVVVNPHALVRASQNSLITILSAPELDAEKKGVMETDTATTLQRPKIKYVLPDYTDLAVVESEEGPDGTYMVPLDPIIAHQQRYLAAHPKARNHLTFAKSTDIISIVERVAPESSDKEKTDNDKSVVAAAVTASLIEDGVRDKVVELVSEQEKTDKTDKGEVNTPVPKSQSKARTSSDNGTIEGSVGNVSTGKESPRASKRASTAGKSDKKPGNN